MMAQDHRPGTFGWFDLTVENAAGVRDFYSKVAGWQSKPLSMGDYDDYVMSRPGSDESVAGICHRQGQNADIPTGWTLYIVVEDLDAAIAEAEANGGKVVKAVSGSPEYGYFAMIEDPEGNHFALFKSGAS